VYYKKKNQFQQNQKLDCNTIVEESKPAIVPIISATSAEMKNSISSVSTSVVCYALPINCNSRIQESGE
jgi:hypothetical protein